MKYDVIIIGSGLGGLACGHILSQSGYSVLVLERQKQPGGCLQSFRRRGFDFDTGLHYIGGLDEGQPLHDVFRLLRLDRLPWHRMDPEGFDRVTISGKTYALAEGYDRFVETLARDFPKEREGLRRYTAMLQQAGKLSFGSGQSSDLLDTNAWQYLNDTFHDPTLINVLSGACLKMELRPETLPLFTFAHGQLSYIQSSWRLKGSGNLMVASLVRDIESYGGKVLCQSEVEELIESDGRIIAARCKNGEVYEGSLFISDAHPAVTFDCVKQSRLLKRVFRGRIAILQNTFGFMTVQLLLKPGMLPYFNHNKFVYERSNVWTFVDDRRQSGNIGGLMINCRVPEDDSAYARQIDLLTPVDWSECSGWENTTVGHRGSAYKVWKEQMAARCIALAETVIPGLSGMIETQYVSSPLTYRDYNLTPEGSAYGVRKDYKNVMMTLLSPRTPLPNLLLTGQSLMLHGIEGVVMTALQTCTLILGREAINEKLNIKN